MTPWTAPSFSAWGRALPARVRARTFAVADVVVAALVAYVVAVSVMRFFWCLSPWAMEGDWKQWIWQYHRYYTPGAFPPGHVITDYQFRVQPPLYYVAMATLSHVMHPGVAARLLSVVAYVGCIVGVARATTRLSHWTMGLAAVVILAHDWDFFRATMGGYPRSFGPTLVVLFLDAWLARQHVRVLACIVAMGGLYPSILPPCGLAYGLWSVVAMRTTARAWIVHNASVVGAGALSSTLALMQSLWALPWWGSVIDAKHDAAGTDADSAITALSTDGRMEWLPLKPFFTVVTKWMFQPFERSGALDLNHVLPWSDAVCEAGGAVVIVVLVALVLRRRGRVPVELVLLAAASITTLFLARELAFRLYLPHRVVQHVLPYVVIIAVPALAFRAFKTLPQALAAALVPVFLLGGDGFLAPPWGRVDPTMREPLRYIREHTPVTAQLAGDLENVDVVPYFTARQVYVNWTMAHPFRPGYWAEMERRLIAMHDALFADDRARVIEFVEKEHIDYFIVDNVNFRALETHRLFVPIRAFVTSIWQAREGRFVLAAPPSSAVVFSDANTTIIDAHRLVEAWR